jgi:hypothetical protein
VATRSPLEHCLRAFIEESAADHFERLALDIFAYQYANNLPYREFCERRHLTPDGITRWQEIPAVPTSAFKVTDLSCRPNQPSAYFLTSGTTEGQARRGRHLITDLSLYEAAILPNAQTFLFPDLSPGRDRITILSLTPSPQERPHSSLIHMIGVLMAHWGDAGSGYYAGEHGVDAGALHDALLRCQADRRAVALLGTTAAVTIFLDHCAARGWSFQLPPGSRLMDTGGAKGLADRPPISRSDLLRRGEAALGIPPSSWVNEYGMTEMCSQFYDCGLADVTAGRVPLPAKAIPHWVKSRLIDPATGDEVRAGEPGLLHHYDLANLHSVMALQTDDVGIAVGDGFEIIGRAAGAEPRGCSMDPSALLSLSPPVS